MQALDIILDTAISSTTKDHIIYTLEDYKEYLKLVKQLDSRIQSYYLDKIKRDEIINNHEMEQENPFLCELELDMELGEGKKTSLDIIQKSVLRGKGITLDNFIKLHRILIRGTSDDIPKNYPLRTHNVNVSYFDSGIEHIQFTPPTPDVIIDYLNKLFSFMNRFTDKEKDEIAIFYKPIIEHFYIAALQPFGNGNTRLARLTEYAEFFSLTRKIIDKSIDSPILFMSKNYLMSGASYRNRIAGLVQNPSQEEIDRWFEFNLNLADEQIYFSKNNVKKLIR